MTTSGNNSDIEAPLLVRVSIYDDDNDDTGDINSSTIAGDDDSDDNLSSSTSSFITICIIQNHKICLDYLTNTIMNDRMVSICVGLMVVGSFIYSIACGIFMLDFNTNASHQQLPQPNCIIIIFWTATIIIRIIINLMGLTGVVTNDNRKVVPVIILYLLQGVTDLFLQDWWHAMEMFLSAYFITVYCALYLKDWWHAVHNLLFGSQRRRRLLDHNDDDVIIDEDNGDHDNDDVDDTDVDDDKNNCWYAVLH